MLDVTRLRVLVAVARHGSVTAAARSLNYAQPSVSHHLARLEAETGTQLTERAGRGVRLTEAGRLLAERAEEILGRLEAAETELAAQVGQRAQRVRLAAFPSALATIGPAAAVRLRAGRPGTELQLTQAEPAQAVQLLRAGHADVALSCRYLQDGEVVYEPAGTGDGIRAWPVLTEPVLLVTCAAMPAPVPEAPAGPAAPRDPAVPAVPPGQRRLLAAHARGSWIAGDGDSQGYLRWVCRQAGFAPNVTVTTSDHVAAQALVAAGLGATVLPELALRAARHPGVHTELLPGASREVLALTYGEPPDPPAVAALLSVLRPAALPSR
jgi:DNA-binding transcriptional LysR family regulator